MPKEKPIRPDNLANVIMPLQKRIASLERALLEVSGSVGTTYSAGDGLTESPAGTFNVGAGYGLDVTANAVDIDPTEINLNEWAAPDGSVAMNTQKLTGLAAGSTSGDSVRYEQVPKLSTDNTLTGLQTIDVSGATDALTIDQGNTSGTHIKFKDDGVTLASILASSTGINLNSSGVVDLTAIGDIRLYATGDIDATTNIIKNVVDPTSNQHAATKKYVDDSVASGLPDFGSWFNAEGTLESGAFTVTADRLYFSLVIILHPATITGIQYRIGANNTGNVKVMLFDKTGGTRHAISNSTGLGATGTYHRVPFTSTYSASPGVHLMGIIFSSSSPSILAGRNLYAAVDNTGTFASPPTTVTGTNAQTGRDDIPIMGTY